MQNNTALAHRRGSISDYVQILQSQRGKLLLTGFQGNEDVAPPIWENRGAIWRGKPLWRVEAGEDGRLPDHSAG